MAQSGNQDNSILPTRMAVKVAEVLSLDAEAERALY